MSLHVLFQRIELIWEHVLAVEFSVWTEEALEVSFKLRSSHRYNCKVQVDDHKSKSYFRIILLKGHTVWMYS